MPPQTINPCSKPPLRAGLGRWRFRPMAGYSPLAVQMGRCIFGGWNLRFPKWWNVVSWILTCKPLAIDAPSAADTDGAVPQASRGTVAKGFRKRSIYLQLGDFEST